MFFSFFPFQSVQAGQNYHPTKPKTIGKLPPAQNLEDAGVDLHEAFSGLSLAEKVALAFANGGKYVPDAQKQKLSDAFTMMDDTERQKVDEEVSLSIYFHVTILISILLSFR